jgi:membrane-associated PAP2 superfamily phosphatase
MYRHHRNLVLLGLATLLLLLLSAPLDMPLGIYARENPFDFLVGFFNLSIFLDNVLGLADIVVFFVLAALGLYFASFFTWGARFIPIRDYCGYIFSTSFAMAISLVHSVKWALSRTRPYDVFPDHLQNFTHWFVPGAYTLDVGFNKGSFPSGHVATMSVLIALFFLMPVARKWNPLRWGYIVLVIAVSMLMGWYRMMYGSHWLTDNLASLMLSILVSYFFYHYLFFPSEETRRLYPLFSRVEHRRPGWAIHLVWQLLLWGFSIATTFVGLRIILIQEKLIHGAFVLLLGVVLSYLFGTITWRALFGPARRVPVESDA